MKLIKIVLGILALLWAAALVVELVGGGSGGGSDLATSRMMGRVAGILIASAIGITLIRSAFKR